MARLLLAAAVAGVVAASTCALPAGAMPINPARSSTSERSTPGQRVPPGVVVRDGETQKTFSYADAIREQVFVESSVDSDRDGAKDRVAVYVSRPKETAGGLEVASIVEGSAYLRGIRDVPYHPGDVTDEPTLAPWDPPSGSRAPVDFSPVYYDNCFVPRGYAVVVASSLGTGDSDGCPTAMGPNEAQGMKAVVDWLNGRARAYDPDGKPVRAKWSTGHVAMAGKSYDGMLALATAGTGVEGLETIVSASVVSSWYDGYRANGGVVAPSGFEGEDADLHAKSVLTRADPAECASTIRGLERDMDRVTGDYNAFWDERNLLNGVPDMKASVFLTAGLNDWNVKPQQFAQLWKALGDAEVPRKLWLHQGGHDDPIDVRRQAWLDAVHGWFDYWLYGVRNGITEEPRVDFETAPGTWSTMRDWPAPDTRTMSIPLGPDGDGRQDGDGQHDSDGRHDADRNGRDGDDRSGDRRSGDRRSGDRRSGDRRDGDTRRFVDDPSRTAEDLVANPDRPDPNRLVFLGDTLDRDVRLSGTPMVTLDASVAGRSPYLTALLVDYGSAARVAGLEKTSAQWCFADSRTGDPGCRPKKEYVTKTTPFHIVTRGWIDVRNRRSASESSGVRPGRPYEFRWNLQAEDYQFKAGHRIGLVVLATDHDYTLRYPAGTKVTVRPQESTFTIPVVGRSGR